MKALGLLLILAVCVRAETTPLGRTLREEKETTITCELTVAPRLQDIPVFDTANDCKEAKGTYHYRLWLPKGYLADTQRRWPCMFIASPSGNAGMGKMASWLKSNDYIVVMLVESKNGSWSPIIGNFLAAHDDAVRRLRIQEGLKFATGMSGGARASSIFVQLRPGFCGLIMQGAGGTSDSRNNFRFASIKRNAAMYVAMTMGDGDSNKDEVPGVKAALGPNKLLCLSFEGGHTWAPQETFEEAIAWIEHQVYDASTANPALKLVYLQRFQMQADKLSSLTVPLNRYKLASALVKFAQSRNLTMEPVVAPVLHELQAEIAKLRADPKVAPEIQAEMRRHH